MASQILSGLDGIGRRLEPGQSADMPYEAKTPLLPKTLSEALAALRADEGIRNAFGEAFVDYDLRIKETELARFQLEVTEWEQREYFEIF
jgi:glutamine synthetase